MNSALLQYKYARIGARAIVRPLVRRSRSGTVVIDIGRDGEGEYFDIQASQDAQLEVLDLQPKDRHLVLMVREPAEVSHRPDRKDKFLCGHDERHWFVAAIPDQAPVSTVETAKESLKPELIRSLEQGRPGNRAKRLRRKTDVYIRQGEWFFIPQPGLPVDEKLILRNEPISRGRGSKPHICEFLFRHGGQAVYVCRQHPDGVTVDQYRKLLRRNPAAAKWDWRAMRRNAAVLVRGRISHADHATIRLKEWHQVVMNTESESRAMSSVAFLD